MTLRGAGIFGLSVAYACASRGARVRVIDPRGVAGGASGGIVGALAPHVPEQWNSKKAFQFESLLMAEAYWAEVAKNSGQPTGYVRSGRLQPLADDAAVALAQRRAEGAADLWEGKAVWEVVSAAEQGAWVPPSASGLVVRDTLSALIHPRQATTALAAAVRALGGEIASDGPDAGSVVWATGWEGLVAMSDQHHRQIGNGVKGQALLLDFDAVGQPQLFADALHIVPHTDRTVAIGSTSERDFVDPTAVDDQLDAIYARAMAAFPMLADAPIIARWAGVRPEVVAGPRCWGLTLFWKGPLSPMAGSRLGSAWHPRSGLSWPILFWTVAQRSRMRFWLMQTYSPFGAACGGRAVERRRGVWSWPCAD